MHWVVAVPAEVRGGAHRAIRGWRDLRAGREPGVDLGADGGVGCVDCFHGVRYGRRGRGGEGVQLLRCGVRVCT